MLRYLVDPIFQVINTAGKPATGGYIEVYDHVTGDKYYCASDFDGTLHPFKIPLDSLGSNIILADDASTYDIYAYNRYGSLLMSRHNVSVSSSGGGGGEASRKGTIHKIGLWAVDAADQPPKPNEYWVVDLESPNENEPSGYDRLTVEKAREIHNSGAFFGLRTEHVQNPYEDNLLLETYYDYVSMSQTFELRLSNISGYNEFVEYTLGGFGDYVGVNMYTTSTLLAQNGNGSNVTATFTEANTRTPISSGSKLSVLFGYIAKWLSDLKALAFKDKADLTQDVSGVLPIANGGTNASTIADARTNLDVYSKAEVEALLNGKIVIVASLPATGDQGKIYYVGPSGSGADQYEEYLWDADNHQFIKVGERSLDLSGYKTKQTAVTDPTADGSGLTFIDSASQNANGEMTLHKKTVQDASTTQKGVVQLDSVPTANSTNVPTSGGVYSAMRVGKFHRIGLRSVQASDPSPKPSTDWIIDLESPNANESDGYDRLTVAKAIEIHEAGEVFVFTSDSPASIDSRSDAYYESLFVSSAGNVHMTLVRTGFLQRPNKVSLATVDNYGDYLGISDAFQDSEYWNVTLVHEDSAELKKNKFHRYGFSDVSVGGETPTFGKWLIDLDKPDPNGPDGYSRVTPSEFWTAITNNELPVYWADRLSTSVAYAYLANVYVIKSGDTVTNAVAYFIRSASGAISNTESFTFSKLNGSDYMQIRDNEFFRALSDDGDSGDTEPTFTMAGTVANISSGEKLSVMLGKIAKWFAYGIPLRISGTLTNSDLFTVSNNSIVKLVNTSQNLITINVETVAADEVPNFAVEIDNTNGVTADITVRKKVGGSYTVLKYSVSAGSQVEAGKYYQLTCVGDCWTLAEFEAPSP